MRKKTAAWLIIASLGAILTYLIVSLSPLFSTRKLEFGVDVPQEARASITEWYGIDGPPPLKFSVDRAIDLIATPISSDLETVTVCARGANEVIVYDADGIVIFEKSGFRWGMSTTKAITK